jgi:AmmeMemoRadiSam system protein A
MDIALSAPQVRALLDRHGPLLLALAASSIRHTLTAGQPLDVDTTACAPELAEPGASFVTLRRTSELRGCVGSARAWRPLVADVAGNAAAAAFEDPRFSPLQVTELPGLQLSISILTAPEPIAAASETELLDNIRAGQDGLILTEGSRSAVLLPQVWEMLPDRAQFFAALKEKAGLSRDHWSDTVRASRFEAISVEQNDLFSAP